MPPPRGLCLPTCFPAWPICRRPASKSSCLGTGGTKPSKSDRPPPDERTLKPHGICPPNVPAACLCAIRRRPYSHMPAILAATRAVAPPFLNTRQAGDASSQLRVTSKRIGGNLKWVGANPHYGNKKEVRSKPQHRRRNTDRHAGGLPKWGDRATRIHLYTAAIVLLHPTRRWSRFKSLGGTACPACRLREGPHLR